MLRFLTLLIAFALVVTNGAAVATAMCQHQDGRTHALALASADAWVAAQAHHEESAAAGLSKKGALSDATATWVAGYMLPSNTIAFHPPMSEAAARPAIRAAALASRDIPPLLEPPLA